MLRSKKILGKARCASNSKNIEFCDGHCSKTEPTPESVQLDLHDLNTPVDLVINSDDSDGESVVFDLLEQTIQLSEPEVSTMSTEEFKTLLESNIKEQQQLWKEQMSSLSNNWKETHETPKFSMTNSIFPRFSGADSEDVTEFLTNFNRAARFYKFPEERKAEALPLYLTGNASIWFDTTPGLAHKYFGDLAEALKKQFHSASDIWLLRQKVYDRKQLPLESVSDFAATIRRMGQRVGLTPPEVITIFIQNLRPELKHHVLLQRPDSLEEAERHAKLKESLPDPKPADRTDEILNALAKLQTPTQTPSQQPVVAAYTPPNNEQQTHVRPFHNTQQLTRDDIAQVVRQELRRSTNQTYTQPQRGRRTFDGKPICDFCQKPGHVMAVCRQRLNQRQDPRIPGDNRSPRPWNRTQYNPRANGSRPLN